MQNMAGVSDGGSHIVMDAPPGLEDPRPWLRMRTLLADHGLRVPAVAVPASP